MIPKRPLFLAVTVISFIPWFHGASVLSFAPTTRFRRDTSLAMGFEPEFLSREENQKRTDIRIFLTQRAIQSFISLLLSCRDPHSVRWMENTYSFQNMESYHGTGAFNLTLYSQWDSILRDMIYQEPHQVIVQAKRRGKGQGGWSKKNPYMEERFVEFHIDIDPPSLVQRIISVRDQIAREWVHDLQTIIYANDMILESYHENQNKLRSEECLIVDKDAESSEEDMTDIASVDGSDNIDDDFHNEDVKVNSIVDDDSDDDSTLFASLASGEEEKEESIDDDDDSSVIASMTSDDDRDKDETEDENSIPADQNCYESEHFATSDSKDVNCDARRSVFERNMMTLMLNKAMSHESTRGSNPHRKGSFDLLVLLATQESVHRLLRQYMKDEDRQVSFQWLRNFYIERIPTFFDGNLRYGRADDFLEDILTTPPSFQDMEGGEVGLVDTLRITEDIIAQRTQVANDWLALMEETPQDHMNLQRELLKIRMGNSENNQNNNKESSTTGLSFEDALRAGSEVIETNLNMKAAEPTVSEREMGAFE